MKIGEGALKWMFTEMNSRNQIRRIYTKILKPSAQKERSLYLKIIKQQKKSKNKKFYLTSVAIQTKQPYYNFSTKVRISALNFYKTATQNNTFT